MKNINFKKIIIGAAVSVVLSIILLLLLTLAVYFGDLSDSTVSGLVLLVSVISVICGAFILARNISGGGLVNGLILGILYFLIILGVSACVNGSPSLSFQNLTRFLIILASGMLGGVVGINTAQ